MLLVWRSVILAALVQMQMPMPVAFLFTEAVLEPEDQVLLVGETLELTCTLTSYTGPLNASQLYLEHSKTGRIPAEQLSVISELSLHLTRPNVSLADGGYVHCYMDMSSIGDFEPDLMASTSVSVGNSPRALTEDDVTCVSENHETMTCSWCEAVEDGITSYSLKWVLQAKTVVIRSGVCDVQNRCWCFFGRNNYTAEVQAPYILNITGVSMFGSATSVHYVYANASIVKPNRPEQFVAEVVGNDTILASWTYPDNLEPDLLTLDYKLTSVSQWGDENITTIVGEAFNWTLTNLRPGTRYNLSLSCKPRDGGYTSDHVYALATTEEGVPAVKPEDLSYKRNQSVRVFWKEIPRKFLNGKLTGYEVTWRTDGSEMTDRSIFVKETSVDLDLPKDKGHEVSLRAATRVGAGPSSVLQIPAVPENRDWLIVVAVLLPIVVIAIGLGLFGLRYCLKKCNERLDIKPIEEDTQNEGIAGAIDNTETYWNLENGHIAGRDREGEDLNSVGPQYVDGRDDEAANSERSADSGQPAQASSEPMPEYSMAFQHSNEKKQNGIYPENVYNIVETPSDRDSGNVFRTGSYNTGHEARPPGETESRQAFRKGSYHTGQEVNLSMEQREVNSSMEQREVNPSMEQREVNPSMEQREVNPSVEMGGEQPCLKSVYHTGHELNPPVETDSEQPCHQVSYLTGHEVNSSEETDSEEPCGKGSDHFGMDSDKDGCIELIAIQQPQARAVLPDILCNKV